MRPAPSAFVVGLLLSACASSAEAAEPATSATRASGPIVLDGRLSEPAWQEAAPASGLTQWQPQRGEPARLDLQVRILYDDTCVYVGAWIPKPRSIGPVVGYLHRRDQWSASDWFEVDFDTMHDHFNAYQFYVNPANVQMDVLLMGPGSDGGWDAVWESAVQVEAEGWSVEMKLPLSIFRLQGERGPQTWGLNFGRQEPRSQEVATWMVPAREVDNMVSVFGHLSGIDVAAPRARAELLPYVSPRAQVAAREAGDERGWAARVGFDGRFGVGSSELAVTVLPDFGQVEVDQAVLNLSTVETFLPEKRPFFTQGMEVFTNALGPSFLYSRRVGRGIDAPALHAGERLVERPLAAEILGAGKYIGHLSGGRTIGVLAAVTGDAYARVIDESGREDERSLAPRSEYGVASFTQPLPTFGGRVFGLVTFLNEEGGAGRQAVVAALESSMKSRGGRLNLEMLMASSRTGPKHAPAALGSQQMVRLNAGLGSGGVFRTMAFNVTRDYEVNDVGYLDRADKRGIDIALEKNWDRAWGPVLSMRAMAGYARTEDQTGAAFENMVTVEGGLESTSQLRADVRVQRYLSIEEDRELRTFGDARKKYLHLDPWNRYALEVGTPYHWPWASSASLAYGRRPGGPEREFRWVQTIRPSSRWQVGLDTRYIDQYGFLGYVSTAPGSAPLPGQSAGIPIVGLRRLAQFEQVVRVAYTCSTRLSVQLFVQGLTANWAYRDLAHYRDDATLAPGLPEGAAPPRAQFGLQLLNVNALVRWEFRPGSTAYLVYTRGMMDHAATSAVGSVRPLADLRSVLRQASDDVIQLKVSWFLRPSALMRRP